MSKKIDEEYLEKINKEDSLKYFGNWINEIEVLKENFKNAHPFPYVVVNDFLNTEYAEKIYDLFPTNIEDEDWHKYCNPIEVKYANDTIERLPVEIKNYFYHLSSTQLVEVMSKLTGIDDLEYDEYLHGAGLHIHPKYGRLSVHLDYEKHPISGKERRTNIILFMTKDWNPSWGGSNELWDSDVKECVVKTNIRFNTAIIFKTNDISWHGVPDIINCPENVFRKSLAFYYVSPLNSQKPEEEYRLKAQFIRTPLDETKKEIDHLYEIRRHRRITKEDIEKYAPDWRMEDGI